MPERIDGGSQRYWKQQREAVSRITRLQQAREDLERGRGGPIPFDQALDAVASHPRAVRILDAWGLVVKRHSWNGWPVIVNEDGIYARSWEIPTSGKK